MRLDVYTVVFLRRPSDAPQMSEERLATLQAEHVAFNHRMRQAGHAIITGPLAGQPDVSLRGISVFREPVEETRALMADDPLVKAGRLVFDAFTWYMPEGTLGERPAARVEQSDL